jgi:hypothetical protein
LSLFEGCRQRVNRANAHRVAIAKIWNEFIDTEPYRFRSRINHDGEGGLWLEQVTPIPEETSFLLGEMLYQLRAALDGTIYEAAILIHKINPPPNDHALMFPIYDNPTRFNNKTGYLAPFPKEIRESIESIQPYHVAEANTNPKLMIEDICRILGFINDWARKDRHRRLHVIGSLVPSVAPMFRVPKPAKLVNLEVRRHVFLENETQVARWKIEGYVLGMNVQTNPNLAIDIAFKDAPLPIADNDSLGDRLTAMVAVTDALVGYFETMFNI